MTDARSQHRPVVDWAVHNTWTSVADVIPYLAQRWRDWIQPPLGAARMVVSSGFDVSPAGVLHHRVPANAATDPLVCARHVLSEDAADLAVLALDDAVRSVALVANPHLAAGLARAVNDWVAERWLAADERFRGSILVSPQLPDQAAREIRRLAPDARFCQVLLVANPLGKAFGHRIYHPIYEAAEEAGLPIYVGAECSGAGASSPLGGGFPSFAFEAYSLRAEAAMTYLLSFITHGVFERFPGLRLTVAEAGQSWLPPFVWRADDDFKGLRREVPWVRKLPSVYVHENVRLTTAPLDRAPSEGAWRAGLDSVGGARALLYASGFPRWDMTTVDMLRDVLDDESESVMLEQSARLIVRSPGTRAPGVTA